jgi:hypothetical protein
MEGFADSAFKAMVILPIGAILTWVAHTDGIYWTSIFLALSLVVFKTGKARESRREETSYDLYISRQRVLIRGSVLLTMVLGVASLSAWVILIRELTESFGHLLIKDYATAIAFVIGAGFHLH